MTMWRKAKALADELGETVWTSFLIVAAFCVIVGGVFAFNSVVYPAWLAYQRERVEESKSYNDSTNTALSNFIREYTVLDVKIAEAKGDQSLVGPYKAQQGAILTQMCSVYVTMNDVAPSNRSFIAEHGGCK